MMKHRLITTQGNWFDDLLNGLKQFDFRKGIRDIQPRDIVEFIEANESGIATGNSFTVRVTYVIRSTDFPEHFNWNGNEFTIFQFRVIK